MMVEFSMEVEWLYGDMDFVSFSLIIASKIGVGGIQWQLGLSLTVSIYISIWPSKILSPSTFLLLTPESFDSRYPMLD